MGSVAWLDRHRSEANMRRQPVNRSELTGRNYHFITTRYNSRRAKIKLMNNDRPEDKPSATPDWQRQPPPWWRYFAWIVAFAIFIAVKLINAARRTLEGEPAAAPPPENIQLLREIRDLLAKR